VSRTTFRYTKTRLGHTRSRGSLSNKTANIWKKQKGVT